MNNLLPLAPEVRAKYPNIEVKVEIKRQQERVRQEFHQKSRQVVSETYWRIRSGHNKQLNDNAEGTTVKTILPTLQTFRRLPAMSSSDQPGSSTQNCAVHTVASTEEITTSLHNWTLQMEAEFAKILGDRVDFSEPESANNQLVYWATAWFTCKLCVARTADTRKARRPKPLTFQEACLLVRKRPAGAKRGATRYHIPIVVGWRRRRRAPTRP